MSTQPELRIGYCSSTPLEFTFERVEDAARILMVNADESGSMGSRIHENVAAFDAVAKVINNCADAVILHGFDDESIYHIFYTQQFGAKCNLGSLTGQNINTVVASVADTRQVMQMARIELAKHRARGGTYPSEHVQFLEQLSDLFAKSALDVELIVLSSSDGGFSGGPNSPMAQSIVAAMRSVISQCRCLLTVNVLVGSQGSPEALSFLTGDPERFENRLLFSTDGASKGVLHLKNFDPSIVEMSGGGTATYTVSPGIPCWLVTTDEGGSKLSTWHPESASFTGMPMHVTVRRNEYQSGRRVVLKSEVQPSYGSVTLNKDGQAVFDIITRSLSDNPYLRETSRAELNKLIAQLEALLGTRQAVIAMLTADPKAVAKVENLRKQIESNTAMIRATIDQEGLTPRERASRINVLNNARHLLKGDLRAAKEALEQQALEKEYGFYEAHPNHWLVWLQPAIDELKAQLGLTQADPGDVMAHLSTRIRTAKSTQDGKSRSADRYLDRILAESRERRDKRSRKADPRDSVAFETPGNWTNTCCPISGRLHTDGIAAIPFVADRSDLTSGNIMAGGQNVDRMPIDPGPMLSLSAVRELMWGELGQMASPYSSNGNWYNAAIPVHLGPATNNSMRDLERAIGWLCTGTSAFGPQMAEAIPGALAVLLGNPNVGDCRLHVDALLRTSALLPWFRSYPYVPGTSAFDESAKKESITKVWSDSVSNAAGSACLQNMGCITSFFARMVAGDTSFNHQRVAVITSDLFAWACRNIARSILGTNSADLDPGGVEGVRRFAALLYYLVEIDGHQLDKSAEVAPVQVTATEYESSDVLDDARLAWVLGTTAQHLSISAPVKVADFNNVLNAALTKVPAAHVGEVLGELSGIFVRFDEYVRSTTPADAQPERIQPEQTASNNVQPVKQTGKTHRGFDDIAALESLKPVRFSTASPKVTSVLAAMRRVTKEGKTQWCPPQDSALSLDSPNPSALAWLESHSALYPVRAWLRLVDAGLVGQAALRKLRDSNKLAQIPDMPSIFPRLAQMLGGMANVIRILRRSFAFVLVNANGYADNQWATSPLRTANDEAVNAALGEWGSPAQFPTKKPRAYKLTDALVFGSYTDWPKLDKDGYLPKSRAIDSAGRDILPPVQLQRDVVLNENDKRVCEKACAVMLEALTQSGDFIIGGLHRHSRQVLGEYSSNLNDISRHDTIKIGVILNELVPIVAGRVRGDMQNPRFFEDIVTVLYQLVRLGGDTRRFRAAEPDTMLAKEAAEIRARVKP